MKRKMRCVEIPCAGPPEVLTVATRDCPIPSAGEVLIEVFAAGVNGHDLHHRERGSHPLQPGETDLPGLEIAGVVVALGDGVSRWSLGDRVCALVRGGGYAEYTVAHAEHCLPVPEGLSMTEAASLPETFATVWSNVFLDGRLRPGQSLLVHGGSSGIGVAAIQLASTFGSQVFATTSSDEKARACLELGATAVFNRSDDFVAGVRAATGNSGVHMILDIAGGDFTSKNIDALALDGRLCVIAAIRGHKAQVDLLPIVQKRAVLTGSLLRPRSIAYKASVVDDLRARVWPEIARRRIRPVISRTYPLQDAALAHRFMMSGQHTGKIVLQVREGAVPPS